MVSFCFDGLAIVHLDKHYNIIDICYNLNTRRNSNRKSWSALLATMPSNPEIAVDFIFLLRYFFYFANKFLSDFLFNEFIFECKLNHFEHIFLKLLTNALSTHFFLVSFLQPFLIHAFVSIVQ